MVSSVCPCGLSFTTMWAPTSVAQIFPSASRRRPCVRVNIPSPSERRNFPFSSNSRMGCGPRLSTHRCPLESNRTLAGGPLHVVELRCGLRDQQRRVRRPLRECRKACNKGCECEVGASHRTLYYALSAARTHAGPPLSECQLERQLQLARIHGA